MRAMRATSPGLQPRGDDATLDVDGARVVARAGDTLAAALVDVGLLTCRLAGDGDPRGVYCGMGVCHECVMLVDGTPARTCMTQVRDGMHIEVAPDRQLPTPTATRLEAVSLEPDVLVIGGGAGGLAAAAAAAEAGAGVLLVDERPKLGGQYYKQPSDGFDVDEQALDRQYREGQQ